MQTVTMASLVQDSSLLGPPHLFSPFTHTRFPSNTASACIVRIFVYESGQLQIIAFHSKEIILHAIYYRKMGWGIKRLAKTTRPPNPKGKVVWRRNT